jgi:hypothetical protein
MHKKIITLFLFICCIAIAYAQNDDTKNSDTVFLPSHKTDSVVEQNDFYDDTEIATQSTDTYNGFSSDVLGDTMINFRAFQLNEDSLAYWKTNKKYAWITNLDSLLHEKQLETEDKQKDLMRKGQSVGDGLSAADNFFNSAFLKMFLWLIAGGVVFYIIYQLFLSKGVFGKASKKATTAVVEEEVDNNMESDFDSLQRRAYAAGDLRVAMRYLFLKTLQKLNDKELIRFAVDKTNSAYARELPPAKRNEFSSLALYYEYIWYGNIAVQKNTFDGIETKFNQFLQKI